MTSRTSRYLAAFLLLSLATAMAADKNNRTVRWAEGAPGSGRSTANDLDSRILTEAGLRVQVALIERPTYWIVALEVHNNSDQPVEVKPKGVKLEAMQPKRKSARSISADDLGLQLVEAIVPPPPAQRNVQGELPTSSGPGGAGNRSAPSQQQDAGPSSRNTPKLSKEKQEKLEAAQKEAEVLQRFALREVKLPQGKQTAGYVYFEKKEKEKMDAGAQVTVKLGDVTFEVPVVPGANQD